MIENYILERDDTNSDFIWYIPGPQEVRPWL